MNFYRTVDTNIILKTNGIFLFYFQYVLHFPPEFCAIGQNSYEVRSYDNVKILCYEENFTKYHLIMFAMAKLMEMTKEEQNQVTLYLFNDINS